MGASDVAQRMEKIKFVFQHALTFSSNDDLALDTYLKEADADFRAVAYEGVAMGLALRDFEEGVLNQWRAFMRRSDPVYQPHVHVGLGWAIAKQQIPSLLFLSSLPPAMLFRVFDGYGYYDGTLRQRQSIQNKVRPEVASEYAAAYDQGLGRSLWYQTKGAPQKTGDLVSAFPPERHAALWRGVGIACAFVGGSDEDTLNTLADFSAHARKHLALGVATATMARFLTNTFSADTELACQILCGQSAEKTIALFKEAESSSETDTYTAYVDKLSKLESNLDAVLKLG
jgi:enediyne biosynthesis protein E3